MDAFFVAVELLDAPELVGRPVVVGGTGERGVVASASYEARAYGVRSAMPTAVARRLCPDAVFIGGRFDRYSAASTEVHEILRSFTPLVERIGLDEAFLDVAGAHRLFGDGPTIAHAVRDRIAGELGLSCSVGVAPRKLTAKLASEAAKPRPSPSGPVPGPGVYVVDEAGELAFLHAHPVEALWGVGPATLRRLERFGVKTVGQLAELPEQTLVGALGRAAGQHLHALAWARDERPVTPERAPKSVGHEETFPRDLTARDELEREVVRLADAVADRLREHAVAARTLQLKVRFGDFRTITRSVTLEQPVDAGPELARTALELLAAVDTGAGVRLLGVSGSGLVDGGARQLRFEELTGRWAGATGAVDEIRRRFGRDAIGPARLAGGEDRLRPGPGGGARQWGPLAEDARPTDPGPADGAR